LIPGAGSGIDPIAPARLAVKEGVTEVSIAVIKANPHQPRRSFSEDEIAELAASIEANGVLQPLLVRPEGQGEYTLIAGERRLRAATRAGLQSVPVLIKATTDDRLLEVALIENIQRENLGPIETAQAFRALIRSFGLTQAEVASRVGKPRSTVANFLRLLELSEEVQDLLADGVLTMGHGRALAALTNVGMQTSLAKAAADRGWSVRELEDRVRRSMQAQPVAGGAKKEPAARDPNVAAAETELGRSLAARVKIQSGSRGKGRIEIRFADAADLDRIYGLLMRAGRS